MEADPIFPISLDPVAMLEARSELRALDKTFSRLQERDVRIVEMRAEGHTLREIGAAIGRSQETARVRIYRAMWKLREARWKNAGELERWTPKKHYPKRSFLDLMRRDSGLRDAERVKCMEGPVPAREAMLQQEREFRASCEALLKQRREEAELARRRSGRIVRNGVEVWPPWPKRK